MLGGGVEVAHITLAERTLFWINSLLSGHGPEAVASRAEKYRTAHHCDIIVEADEGISFEWLKEDYEIPQVECYNREQKGPSLLELSYSCKPGNYGGLLEGVVVLELQVCAGNETGRGRRGETVPPAREVLPLEAPSCRASREVGSTIANVSAVAPEMVLTQQTAGPVRQGSQKKTLADETGYASQTSGSVLETTLVQTRATQTPATSGKMPQGGSAAKPLPTCLPPSSDSPLITRSPSVFSRWRRWCPMRSSSPAIASSPSAAPCKEAAGAGPEQASSQSSSGAISKLPELVTASSPVLPGQTGNKAQRLDAGSRGRPVASHGTDWARYGGERYVGDRAGPLAALPVALSRRPAPALEDVRPEAESIARPGFCTIYFSVDSIAGNHYGVCCLDDLKKPTLPKPSGSAIVSGSELPWWLQGVCTRRHGKVERHPSKVACWRAATAAGNGELNGRSPVFGAHERMQPRREDCVSVSVSAEMTSCMDATLKVKLQLAEIIASSAVVTLPAETGASLPQPVLDVENSSRTDTAPLALLHHPMEHLEGMPDLPASDPAVSSSPGLTAGEVILDVSKPAGTGVQSDESDPASSDRTVQQLSLPDVAVLRVAEQNNGRAKLVDLSEGQASADSESCEPGDAQHADKGSPTPLPNPWEALQPSSADPWEALRSALQPPNFMAQALQPPSFMTQVWYVSQPAQSALTVISPEPEPFSSRIQTIGSNLLAVASAPPLMTQSIHEAPDHQVSQALSVALSNGAASQGATAASDPTVSPRLRTNE